jgi:spore coat polysaccharide biosynthesis predicted glycosyltransferase SpsG
VTGERVVALRADAGPGVGLGHLQRTLGLAVALRENGCSCIVRAPGVGDVRARVEALELRFESASARWSLAEEVAALEPLGADAVVIDSYKALEDDLSLLRRGGHRSLVIDDLASSQIFCDVVVNAAAGASSLPYDTLAPGARLLLGTEYVLLHPKLWDVTPRAPTEHIQTVLLTGGGSVGSVEPLQKLLSAVAESSAAFDLLLAVPAGVAAALEPSIRTSRRNVSVVSPEATIQEAAVGVGAAVASAGGTTRELLRLGVPTLAVVTADNQRHGAKGLARVGAVELFESVDEAVTGLPHALDELVASYEERRRLADRGPQVIDGQGCRRVASAVLELFE